MNRAICASDSAHYPFAQRPVRREDTLPHDARARLAAVMVLQVQFGDRLSVPHHWQKDSH